MGHLVLTDGGVLENLGVQLLQRSRTYGCRQIVVSDAEVRGLSWRRSWASHFLSFGAYALTDTLKQLLVVMNGKQNRSMRQLVVAEALER